MPENTSSSPYMLQLDALRAFAVASVIFGHFNPFGIDWGLGSLLGVKLFFTISGFLITGILLEARQRAEIEDCTRLSKLTRFYVRRFLRIFPIYYLVVGIAYAINLEPARQLIGWLLTYTLNIYMAQQGWFENHFAHFWSLAVEEQFYLCWPWLILFLPRNWLLAAILVVISIGPLYRWSYVISNYENMTALSTYVSTLSSLDHLGFGALLALVVRRFRREMIFRITLVAFPVASLASVALIECVGGDITLIFFDVSTAIVFCCAIFWAGQGVKGTVGRLLEWKPLIYVGRISYGLYVYHPFMPPLAIWLLLQIGITNVYSPVETMLGLVMTVVIASISWHLFEKPINDLKRHF